MEMAVDGGEGGILVNSNPKLLVPLKSAGTSFGFEVETVGVGKSLISAVI